MDVARASGVTAATVSRVLNGKTDFSASEEVRARIQETAHKLGYVPDLAARNLNRKEARIIGLFSSPETHLGEGINESLLEGVAKVLHAQNYDVFFELAAGANRREALPFWRFDGAILLQSPRPETVAELDRRQVPYVCVNEQIGHPAASVLADDVQGMRDLIAHLASCGHKRIAYANARSRYFVHHSIQDRHRTLVSECKALGLELVPGHDAAFTNGEAFLQAAVRKGRATAVVTYDHQIGVLLVGAAHAMDLRIPQDFGLACFNDVFPVDVLPVPLTAVAVSGHEMGRVGAQLLLDRLAGKEPRAAASVRIEEKVIVRASTAMKRRPATKH